MDRREREAAYWDERASLLLKPKSISDNWKKRRQLIRRLLDYEFTETSVLEIGCGCGFTAHVVDEVVGGDWDYIGCDVSQKFVDAMGTNFNLKAITARADALPFEDRQFDSVLAFDVLEHIHPDDQAKVAGELSRVMKSVSRLFINNPHPFNPCAHVDEMDHGFDAMDQAGLSLALGMVIERVDLYTIDHGEPNQYRYQFIVMGRGQ